MHSKGFCRYLHYLVEQSVQKLAEILSPLFLYNYTSAGGGLVNRNASNQRQRLKIGAIGSTGSGGGFVNRNASSQRQTVKIGATGSTASGGGFVNRNASNQRQRLKIGAILVRAVGL